MGYWIGKVESEEDVYISPPPNLEDYVRLIFYFSF